MMRYMWIINPALAPTNVQERFDLECLAYKARVFNSRERTCWVMITNYADYSWALSKGLVDTTSDPWNITACNKQYVTNYRTGKYIGCMSEVTSSQARAWAVASDNNWYLRDLNNNMTWIPVKSNPNKLIPTGDKTADGLWPKQTRKWPLSDADYQQWKDDVIERVTQVLVDTL